MRVVRVLDRQRALPVERRWLRAAARLLLGELAGRADFELGVHLIGAQEMIRLNATFLGHEGSTDVITFDNREDPLDMKLCGEIFICGEDALANARRFGVSWQWEIARYLVHGVLHLEGWEDGGPAARRAMKRRENQLLKELSRRFDLDKLEKQ
jgi:probable rRNA maturation factor